MNLKPGTIIKHKEFKDVCFEVKKSFVLPHKTKVRGYWYNLGFTKSWLIDANPRNIEIKTEDLVNWEWLKNSSEVECYRNGTWAPIRVSRPSEPTSDDSAS